ncbi:MAG: hypothetical protein JWQ72_2031 [Polaromonas sp.]|nr:hypothetical protein [Polaromonas sp.]
MSTVHSLASFVLQLESMAVQVVRSEQQGLKAAAKIVKAEAKSEFGVYQDGVDGFNAWANLAEATVRDRIAKGFSPDDPLLRTGDLRDSVSYKVGGMTAVIGSTSDVMVYQELGTSTIPPRPVLGPALARKRSEVLQVIGNHAVGALLNGSFTPHPLITSS